MLTSSYIVQDKKAPEEQCKYFVMYHLAYQGKKNLIDVKQSRPIVNFMS